MFKMKNTLLLLAILFTACSSQESNDKNETNTTVQTKQEVSIKQTESKNTEEKNSTKNVEQNVTQKEKASEEKASLFALKTLDGQTIHINETEGGLIFEEYKDKAVLLLFFGHKCPPCLREIPVLKALVEEGHKDLAIIAIEVQGYTKEQLEAFRETKGINYTLATYDDSLNFINYIGQQTHWRGAIPFLVGFDKNNIVQIVHAGGLSAKDFDNIYKSLVQGE